MLEPAVSKSYVKTHLDSWPLVIPWPWKGPDVSRVQFWINFLLPSSHPSRPLLGLVVFLHLASLAMLVRTKLQGWRTPRKTNMSPKKGAISKGKYIVFQPLCFTGHVSFPGSKLSKDNSCVPKWRIPSSYCFCGQLGFHNVVVIAPNPLGPLEKKTPKKTATTQNHYGSIRNPSKK